MVTRLQSLSVAAVWLLGRLGASSSGSGSSSSANAAIGLSVDSALDYLKSFDDDRNYSASHTTMYNDYDSTLSSGIPNQSQSGIPPYPLAFIKASR